MTWFKRIFLFVAVNILVILTINITLTLLGVRPYLTANGLNYESLLIFCAVVGFSGAFISLMISKFMVKMAYRIKIIDPRAPSTDDERFVLQTVHRLSEKAGITKMPEVGIYPSQEVNAFATGPSKNSALIAVSQGLLSHMSREEAEGVIGHEVSHVTNGDMVTMTLIQGVVNTFVMFFARIAAWAVANALRGNDDRIGASPMLMWVLVFVFDIAFSLLGSTVVAAFSRWREFRADAGSARVAGRDKMVAALQSLQRYKEAVETEHPAYATLKINGRKPGGLAVLFASHPSLEDRIQRLQRGRF